MQKKILSSKIQFGYVKLYGFHGNPLCDFRECGCTYKNAHITAATHHRKLNFVPNKLLDIELSSDGQNANYIISLFMNINENIRNERKIVEK